MTHNVQAGDAEMPCPLLFPSEGTVHSSVCILGVGPLPNQSSTIYIGCAFDKNRSQQSHHLHQSGSHRPLGLGVYWLRCAKLMGTYLLCVTGAYSI